MYVFLTTILFQGMLISAFIANDVSAGIEMTMCPDISSTILCLSKGVHSQTFGSSFSAALLDGTSAWLTFVNVIGCMFKYIHK